MQFHGISPGRSLIPNPRISPYCLLENEQTFNEGVCTIDWNTNKLSKTLPILWEDRPQISDLSLTDDIQ